MNKQVLDKRLQELGIYNDYFYRKELKSVAQLLRDGESLNCLLTGVHEGNRKMVAITGSRILIVFAGALGSGEAKVIKREAVKDSAFVRKFPFSSCWFTLGEEEERYEFTNTQRGRKELYEWAMSLPVTAI